MRDQFFTYKVIPFRFRTIKSTVLIYIAADPTDPRIDVILVDDLGAVSVLTGTPAPVPSKPTVDNLTEVEITFVSVPAGATSPPIVIETIYDEDAGSGGGEWDATTDVVFQTLAGEMAFDYSDFGGLKNTEASGFTGDVNVVLPACSAGDTGTIVCEWIKVYES